MHYLVSLLFLVLFFTGCASKHGGNNFVFSITQEELTHSLKNEFPIKENFVFGNLLINTPKINMHKNSQFIDIDVDFSFSTILTPTQKGGFSIHGKPYFNATKRAIYLKEVKLNHLHFANKAFDRTLSKAFDGSLNDIINEFFKKQPIYTIPNDSFHRNRVKDIEILEGKLAIHYGF